MLSFLSWWNQTWQDFVKTIFFFSFFFTCERVLFLAFHSKSWILDQNIFQSLWLGLRFSLMTSFFPAIGLVILARITHLLFRAPKIEKQIRQTWIFLFIIVSSFLFIARFSFYENYQSNFNSFIFQGKHENLYNIIISIGNWQEWFILLASATSLSFIFIFLWRFSMEKLPYIPLPSGSSIYRSGIFFLLTLFLVTGIIFLCRYGGAFRSADKMRWENVARLPERFLNELILDDYQALIRARDQYKAMAQGTTEKISFSEMQNLGKILKKDPSFHSTNWDNYVKKNSLGNRIPKPKHIFIILAESYGQWPMLPKYQNWGMTREITKLVNEPNSVWIQSFLPNGMFTHYAVAALTSGIIGFENSAMYMPESYDGAFSTSLAPQLKKLGYETFFWYGGPGSWVQVDQYTRSQGFDHFYGSGEMNETLDNAWGIDDRDLFNYVFKSLNNENNSCHVILTTSNHPPFSIDLEKEGFYKEDFISSLPEEIKSDDETLRKIGHFWYMDREIGTFVSRVREKYPDSLFIIMGDHSTRIGIEDNFSTFERISIPLIFSGPGINPTIFPSESAGSQIQVIPTLIELISPKNFEYYAVAPSLTNDSPEGVSYDWWITANQIGNRHTKELQTYRSLNIAAKRNLQWEESIVAFSWWRLNKDILLKN